MQFMVVMGDTIGWESSASTFFPNNIETLPDWTSRIKLFEMKLLQKKPTKQADWWFSFVFLEGMNEELKDFFMLSLQFEDTIQRCLRFNGENKICCFNLDKKNWQIFFLIISLWHRHGFIIIVFGMLILVGLGYQVMFVYCGGRILH